MITLEGMITVAEAASRLQRSTEQVRRYLREGKLPGQRIGNQWFVEERVVATATRHEQQMEVLKRIRENREAILRESGLQPRGAEIIRQVREDRMRQIDRRVRRRQRRA